MAAEKNKSALEIVLEGPLPRRPLHEKDDHDLGVHLEAKKSKIHDANETPGANKPSNEGEIKADEVDVVQLEEFEFLDGVTRLATLESGDWHQLVLHDICTSA